MVPEVTSDDPRPKKPTWADRISRAPVLLAIPIAMLIVFRLHPPTWAYEVQLTALLVQFVALLRFTRFVDRDIAWMNRDLARQRADLHARIRELQGDEAAARFLVDCEELEARLEKKRATGHRWLWKPRGRRP